MKADMYTHQILFYRPLNVIIDNTMVIKQEADHSIKTCPRCDVTIVGNWKFRNNPITGKPEVKCPSINCDSWAIKEL